MSTTIFIMGYDEKVRQIADFYFAGNIEEANRMLIEQSLKLYRAYLIQDRSRYTIDECIEITIEQFREFMKKVGE